MAIYGDTSGILRDHQQALNQDIALADDVGGIAYGDADQMFDNSQGGDDTLTAGARADNTLYGDANTMHDRA
ncbi:MAG TPA: calcium-binding protein, partial [Reyranella sp.]